MLPVLCVFVSLWFTVNCLVSPAHGQGIPGEATVFDLKQPVTFERGTRSWIYFSLRMPPGWKAGNSATGPDKVRGVLCTLRWFDKPESVHALVAKRNAYTDFADRNGLALLSWNRLKFYTTGVSNDEMDEKADDRWSEKFDIAAREWEKGIKRLVREYGIPERDYLLHGFSGGAQTAHRLALRKAQYFSAIHIHVNSSYDKPGVSGKDMIWLLTTGEREYGYRASQRFYYEGLENGYSMVYKVGVALGHSTSPQIDRLGFAFFNYALRYLPDYREKQPVRKGDMHALLRRPPYVGDWLNQEFVAANRAHLIQGRYQTALPTLEIARIWGQPLDGGPGNQGGSEN